MRVGGSPFGVSEPKWSKEGIWEVEDSPEQGITVDQVK